MKVIHKSILLFFAGIGISLFTQLLPQSSGLTVGSFYNRQTNTYKFVKEIYASGYPVKFYVPGGYDYGSNFMTEAFLVNTLLILVLLFVGGVLFKKLHKSK
jgi:hypothetical protein